MVYFDLIVRQPEDNAVLIRGWGFNENTDAPLELEVETDRKVEKILFKREPREDVNTNFNLDLAQDYGFIAKVCLDELKGPLKLVFTDKDSGFRDERNLNLNRKWMHYKEVNTTFEALKRIAKQALQLLKSGNGSRYIFNQLNKQLPGTDPVYARWIGTREKPLTPERLEEINQEISQFKYKPKISILVPVYKVDLRWLERMLSSVLSQTYTNWQLCLVDDGSDDPEIKKYLENFYDSHKEIQDKLKFSFQKENRGISYATNKAFEMSDGEFIGFLDHDDELSPEALFEVVKYINEFPDTDIIYSDEDKIDENEVRNNPHFKPDYAPNSLMSNNYICHFTVIRRSLIQEGEELMRLGYEGAQDHDLLLRLTERTNKIGHIPKILYHWRKIEGSTALDANYKTTASDAGIRALEDALKRRGLSGQVKPLTFGGFYEVLYDVDESKKVSVIIPTKNNALEIRACINSIIKKTEYKNYEIIIVDNGSDDEKALRVINDLKDKYPDIIKVLRLPIPFNYSRINNRAADFATGDFYLFLNDDTQVITRGWMKKMLGYAALPDVGCVGAKLLYPDNTIQHAGVIMGILGIAGHVFTRLPRSFQGYFRRCELNVNYTAVTAACLMIEKDKFWQVGGFDENLVVAFNDVDLCCKVAEAGYYNVYLGSVELYHFESQSRGYEDTPFRAVRANKETDKIRKKWRKYIRHDPMYNPNLTLLRGDYTIDA